MRTVGFRRCFPDIRRSITSPLYDRRPETPGAGVLVVSTVTLAQPTMAAPSTPVVAAICAAEILGLAGFSIIPALLPQFIDAWSLTNTQAGWLAGIVSAGYMLAVIPLVGLTDRRSGPANLSRLERPERAVLLWDGAVRQSAPGARIPRVGRHRHGRHVYARACGRLRMASKGQPAPASRPGTPAPSPSARRCRSCSAASERCWAGAALLLSPASSAPPAS